MSARVGMGRSEGFPEQVSSCRPDPLNSGRAKNREFCMDNIEHGPEQVKAPVGPGAVVGMLTEERKKRVWVGI